MKKYFVWISIFLSPMFITPSYSANLIEVYQQALCSDQVFQQAISQSLSDKENVPINLAALLPALGAVGVPAIAKANGSGSSNLIGDNTVKSYDFRLTLTQTIFDFSKYAAFNSARDVSKQADASINAAIQDLMLRVAKAYFAVLNDEDNIRNNVATKAAFAKQLEQAQQQFKVGLKTITDVYTAQASYDSSVATYITAVNNLADDKENLRVITGIFYPSLAKLSEKFPLVTPNPNNIDAWVEKAQRQNWSIKAACYAAQASREIVKQQFAGHFPTLSAEGSYEINFQRTIASPLGFVDFISNQPTVIPVGGSNQVSTSTALLRLNIPIVQGGLVVAQTRKAQYNYQNSLQKLEQQTRNSLNNTRQSYLGVLSGISKINADKQTIKSYISSLEGLQASYQVGTETLVDVLNQQQKVFQAQTQYAADRYAYVNSLLALKAAAGTLCVEDLRAINAWLIEGNDEESECSAIKTVCNHTRHLKSCPLTYKAIYPKSIAKYNPRSNLRRATV